VERKHFPVCTAKHECTKWGETYWASHPYCATLYWVTAWDLRWAPALELFTKLWLDSDTLSVRHLNWPSWEAWGHSLGLFIPVGRLQPRERRGLPKVTQWGEGRGSFPGSNFWSISMAIAQAWMGSSSPLSGIWEKQLWVTSLWGSPQHSGSRWARPGLEDEYVFVDWQGVCVVGGTAIEEPALQASQM
jgi:hypothetical protein